MIKVAITGPECSGKSSLAEALTSALSKTELVPEVAREYLTQKGEGYVYSFGDVEAIGELQYEYMQQAFGSKADYVICDTEMLVVKIWMDVVFGRVSSAVNQRLLEQQFDIIFLCYPDLIWEPDPLRENPHNRELLFEIYEKELKISGKTYFVIRGEQRLELALRHLATLR